MKPFCQYVNLHRLFARCLHATYRAAAAGADYAIQETGGVLYLLFEHSRGSEDWKSNLNFPARAYDTGGARWYVHRGFLRVWKAIRAEIEEQVATAVVGGHIQQICIIGYSHGAALCGLCTEDMAYLYGGRLPVCGYGFGCPRFIWGPLPGGVQERFEHFTVIRNLPDAVTYLPPAIFGYHHVGRLLEIGQTDAYSPIDAHRENAYLIETAAIS